MLPGAGISSLQDFFCYKGAHPVLDKNIVCIPAGLKAAVDRLKPFLPPRHNGRHLCDAEFFHNLLPAVCQLIFSCNQNNIRNQVRSLECLQGMNQNRLSFQFQILLADSRPHPPAGSGSHDDSRTSCFHSILLKNPDCMGFSLHTPLPLCSFRPPARNCKALCIRRRAKRFLVYEPEPIISLRVSSSEPRLNPIRSVFP